MSVVRLPIPYPLDRRDLREGEWTEDQLLADAKAAGYWVTRRMIRAWVKQGMLPAPKKGTE